MDIWCVEVKLPFSCNVAGKIISAGCYLFVYNFQEQAIHVAGKAMQTQDSIVTIWKL